MASDTPVADYSRPITPDRQVNGHTNGPTTPKTPTRTGLALTEYTANPSPPNEHAKLNFDIPEAFLLPNGYPDVRNSRLV
jgi:threonine dehydratase